MSSASGLIGGLLGVGIDIHSAKQASKSQKTANDLMVQEAQKNREQADTAHQREVKDLLAAGLNPILSAGGQGAASPAPMPNIKSAKEVSSGIMSRTAEKLLLGLNMEQMRETIKNTAKQGELIDAQTQDTLNSARMSAVNADFYDSPYGRFINGLRNTMSAILPIVNSASQFGRSRPYVNELGDAYDSVRSHGIKSKEKYPDVRRKYDIKI